MASAGDAAQSGSSISSMHQSPTQQQPAPAMAVVGFGGQTAPPPYSQTMGQTPPRTQGVATSMTPGMGTYIQALRQQALRVSSDVTVSEFIAPVSLFQQPSRPLRAAFTDRAAAAAMACGSGGGQRSVDRGPPCFLADAGVSLYACGATAEGTVGCGDGTCPKERTVSTSIGRHAP